MQLYALKDYVQQARVFLQDTVPPYRYDDESLVSCVNSLFYEVARLRSDILIDGKYQQRSQRRQRLDASGALVFTVGLMDDPVPLPPPYKMTFVYGIVGLAQLRDSEDTQDTRAAAFLSRFIAQLTTPQA